MANDQSLESLKSDLKDAIEAAIKRDSIRYSVLSDKNMAPGERKALETTDAATSFLNGESVTAEGISSQLSNIASVDASEDASFSRKTGGSTQNLKLKDTNGNLMVYSELKNNVNPLNSTGGKITPAIGADIDKQIADASRRVVSSAVSGSATNNAQTQQAIQLVKKVYGDNPFFSDAEPKLATMKSPKEVLDFVKNNVVENKQGQLNQLKTGIDSITKRTGSTFVGDNNTGKGRGFMPQGAISKDTDTNRENRRGNLGSNDKKTTNVPSFKQAFADRQASLKNDMQTDETGFTGQRFNQSVKDKKAFGVAMNHVDNQIKSNTTASFGNKIPRGVASAEQRDMNGQLNQAKSATNKLGIKVAGMNEDEHAQLDRFFAMSASEKASFVKMVQGKEAAAKAAIGAETRRETTRASSMSGGFSSSANVRKTDTPMAAPATFVRPSNDVVRKTDTIAAAPPSYIRPSNDVVRKTDTSLAAPVKQVTPTAQVVRKTDTPMAAPASFVTPTAQLVRKTDTPLAAPVRRVTPTAQVVRKTDTPMPVSMPVYHPAPAAPAYVAPVYRAPLLAANAPVRKTDTPPLASRVPTSVPPSATKKVVTAIPSATKAPTRPLRGPF